MDFLACHFLCLYSVTTDVSLFELNVHADDVEVVTLAINSVAGECIFTVVSNDDTDVTGAV